MNKLYFKIFAAAGVLFSLVACNHKAEYKTESFVAFGASTVSVSEDAGSIEIPVYAYAKNGDYAFPRADAAKTTVTFEVVPGSAEEGKNYTIEPANGVLTFDGTTSEQKIVVKVVDHDGVIDPAVNFSIRITSASDGFTLGGLREVRVDIQDADNPLAYLYGTYVAKGVSDYRGTTKDITLTISAVDGSLTEVQISGFVPGIDQLKPAALTGVVAGELITIASAQKLAAYDGEDVLFYAIEELDMNAGRISLGESLVLQIDSEKKTLTARSGWGAMSETADGISLYDAYVTKNVVFTMQQ